MIKALLKKQLLELFSGFVNKEKDSKAQGKGARAGIIVILGFAGISILMMFFSFAYMLSELISDGSGWLYFSVTGLLASLFGIMGSVFLTYNTIYEAKDNDLLLSMPIPPRILLFTRLTGLYLNCLLFEALITVPSFIVYTSTAPFTVTGFAFSLINLFILPFAAVGISLILGWVIALFSSRIRNKSIITVVFSLVFFCVYYLGAMRLNDVINVLVSNAEIIGGIIRKWLFPVYLMGQGSTGDILSFLLYLAILFVFFILVYAVLSRSFFRLATTKRGMKKAEYKEKSVKRASAGLAFFRKELQFFKNTPIYILNCALGSVICILFSIILAVKKELILSAFSVLSGSSPSSYMLICASLLCFFASTNNLTSASISLEGKTLWLLKSVPVDVKDIFFGKLMLHISVTGIPLLISEVIAAFVLKSDIASFLMTAVFSQVFVALCALTGLTVNLIFPKTDWVNETVPIKQSMSVFLSMLAGMLYSIFILLVLLLTGGGLPVIVYFIIYTVVFLSIGALLSFWLVTKGQKKFLSIGN